MFNMIRNQLLFKRIRYVSIARSKLCVGMILPALTSFLNEDEKIVRFSFIHNNMIKPQGEQENEDDPQAAKKKKVSRLSNTLDK